MKKNILILLGAILALSVGYAAPSWSVYSGGSVFEGRQDGPNGRWLTVREETGGSDSFLWKTNILSTDQWVTNDTGVYKGGKWFSYSEDGQWTWYNSTAYLYIGNPQGLTSQDGCSSPWPGSPHNYQDMGIKMSTNAYWSNVPWSGSYKHENNLMLHIEGSTNQMRLRVTMDVFGFDSWPDCWSSDDNSLYCKVEGIGIMGRAYEEWTLLGQSCLTDSGGRITITTSWTYSFPNEVSIVPYRNGGNPSWFEYQVVNVEFVP